MRRIRIGAQSEQTSEWIRGRWRLFSAGYYACFHVEVPADVLKASLPLWSPRTDPTGGPKPLPVLTDHRLEAGAWLGTVEAAEWVDATDGMPAGIDGDLALSTASDPRIIAGVSSGGLRSVSAGLELDCSQSHPDLSEADFLAALGDELDGETVRWVAAEVIDVREVSVVWDGADPHARRLDAARVSIRAAAGAPQEVASMPQMESAPLAEALGLGAEAAAEELVTRAAQLISREATLVAVVELIRSAEAAGEERETEEQAEGASDDMEGRAVEAARRMLAGAERRALLAAERSVDEAIAAGKFDASKRADLVAVARKDRTTWRTMVAAARSAAPSPPTGHARPTVDSMAAVVPAGLTVPDERRLRALGFASAADFIKYASRGPRRHTAEG